MSEIKIEKGIPIPQGGGGFSIYPWGNLKIGDSFLAPALRRQGMYSIAQRHGYRVVVRAVQGTDNVRVWRVE